MPWEGLPQRRDRPQAHEYFHQMDGLYLHPTSERTITQDDLKEVLANVVKAAFGPDIKYRFNDDNFPYTHSSLEMEVDKDGQWLEVLGAGLVQPGVLEKLNVDPNHITVGHLVLAWND
jgi:phenylalanyl-tRNA synthetase alpha chain